MGGECGYIPLYFCLVSTIKMLTCPCCSWNVLHEVLTGLPLVSFMPLLSRQAQDSHLERNCIAFASASCRFGKHHTHSILYFLSLVKRLFELADAILHPQSTITIAGHHGIANSGSIVAYCIMSYRIVSNLFSG